MTDVALAVVIKDKKVLIQKRFRRNQGFVYEFPGGAVDPSESIEEAAIRELREETGLNLSEVSFIQDYPNQLGGKTGFVGIKANNNSKPICVEQDRQQTFYWLEVSDVPLDSFHPIDLNFIQTKLANLISSI